ncbi:MULTISPECIES: phosphate ABC transporter substrate-binding protein [Giesbergeria]|uniref:Phosphate ABC transporter substrate-binding protein n=1 Tax=Giesbergeria sinuosa TaxID=80883 RepID=A0ABV9Q9J4_9BURK
MKNFYIALLGCFIATGALAQNSLVVIANPTVAVDKVDASQVTQIFLKQIQTWPDGKPIQPIDIKEGSPLRTDFYSKITGRSPGQMRSYWARQAFTGMGFPPKELATADDVSKAVQATPGAIGYIDKKNATGSAKIVLDPRP